MNAPMRVVPITAALYTGSAIVRCPVSCRKLSHHLDWRGPTNAVPRRLRKGRQDVIPGSAGIRMHLAQGAVRADFLLRRRPKKIF